MLKKILVFINICILLSMPLSQLTYKQMYVSNITDTIEFSFEKIIAIVDFAIILFALLLALIVSICRKLIK